MKLTLLCNAGFSLEVSDGILLIDVPNDIQPPFYQMPEEIWQLILNKCPPYDRVIGLCFTHTHPDHYSAARVEAYLEKWPNTACFIPKANLVKGRGSIGSFSIRYQRIDHAPIPDAPPHVVLMVEADGKTIYFSGDAALECDAHLEFLRSHVADVAVWNSMYLSRPDTRSLLNVTSKKNLICHMPERSADGADLYWRKLERNLERFGEELQSAVILSHYPTALEI